MLCKIDTMIKQKITFTTSRPNVKIYLQNQPSPLGVNLRQYHQPVPPMRFVYTVQSTKNILTSYSQKQPHRQKRFDSSLLKSSGVTSPWMQYHIKLLLMMNIEPSFRTVWWSWWVRRVPIGLYFVDSLAAMEAGSQAPSLPTVATHYNSTQHWIILVVRAIRMWSTLHISGF
jgi:hypothetical protein